MNSVPFLKIRIAPTPSGYLHIGNAMSFLITAAFAKQADAKLLLRIDDLDRERTQKKYVEDIFDTLRFLGIVWSEGPQNSDEYEQFYSQVHRLNLYEAALQQLREGGHVFACACSRSQLHSDAQTCTCREQNLSLDAPQTSWRLVTDAAFLLTVKTLTGDKIITALPASMQSFVVRKKNGFPSYQLASLIDDEYFGVDAIVRGQDLWDSTLAQQYVAQVLGKPFFSDINFYHHPLLMEGAGKLSKSAGAASVKQLREERKRREDVIRLIAGRSDVDNQIREWIKSYGN